VLWALSLLMVVSMICGTVLVLLPERRPTPTPPRPTATQVVATPEATPTVVLPPTPQPTP